MIEVHILRDKGGEVMRVHFLGHADYGNRTIDVVCVAVSVLELNFANFVEELTDAKFEVHLSEKDGSFDFKLLGERDGKAKLLLQSLLLGYQTIQEAYGSSYLMIKDQEV